MVLSAHHSSKNDHNKEIRKAPEEFKFSKIVEYFTSKNVHENGNVKKYDDTLFKFANEALSLNYSVVESTYLFAYLMDEQMKTTYEKITSLKK